MIRDETYRELTSILRRTLPPQKAGFYSNTDRLAIVVGLIEKWTDNNSRIIDLASGAFLLDFLLENKGKKNIIAIDKDPRLAEVYQELKSKNILQYTIFHHGDITSYSFSEKSGVNLVILNDALFYPEHNLPEMTAKISQSLTMEGIFIFDVWSLEFYQRFRYLYDLIFPQYKKYKRYSVSQVTSTLKQSGFEVKETVPYFSPVPGRKLLEKFVWRACHLSNTIYFVARRIK